MRAQSEVKSSCGLEAIILITRSRPGPKLVFHYPAVPESHHRDHRISPGDELDEDSDVDDDDRDADTNDEGFHGTQSQPKRRPATDQQQNPPDRLVGHSVDSLEKLLSPGRWSDGKKFEIRLDDLTFLSHPVYAGEDGAWSKEGDDGSRVREPQRSQTKVTSTIITTTPTEERKPSLSQSEPTGSTGITITAPQTAAAQTAVHDFTHVPESFTEFGSSMTSTSTTSNGIVADQMAMFNVVFVLSTTSHDEIRDVYRQVAVTLSRALHYCQAQSGYVAVESRRLLALKAKAKQDGMSTTALWTAMLESSELAWALKELYENLRKNEIARIRLNGVEMALQIHLTDLHHTVKGKEANNDPSPSSLTPTPHSALLLLEDRPTLLHSLPDASPLHHFIASTLPTKTLLKTSTTLLIPLPSILTLASHLLHWRKARLIPPLHVRNTYVGNPHAALERIPELAPEYARKFPALPSLAQMLKVLGGKTPVRYGALIPSRDHRGVYMDMLAFLVRYDLVVVMRTFGWLRWSSEEEESGRRRLSSAAMTSGEGLWRPAQTERKATRPRSQNSSQGHQHQSLLSPHLRPVGNGKEEDNDDVVSVSSERTAIPISSIREREEAAAREEVREAQSRDPAVVIILDPVDPTDEERECCEAIEASIEDVEFRERFRQFLPYLDGEHAFEEIAAREGLKRAKVEEWLGELEQRGYLFTFRSL